MPLSKIYAPVQSELTRVEAKLKSLCRADLSWLPSELADDLMDSGRLDELLTHSLEGSGKRIRPALTLLAGKPYNYDPERLLPIATAIEILHTATLVHDDAIDDSMVRRGQPTINGTWDNDKAILLGDYLIAQAVELAASTQNLRVVSLLAQTIMTITSGELAQSFDAFQLEQTREHYLHRIFSKTAALLSLAAESGAILSQAPEESVLALGEYGRNLGIAFQIVDDIMDYIGTEEEMGKPVGSDLAQGTLTLPTILLLERYPGDNPVKEWFRNRERPENIKQAIELIRDSSIVEECYVLAQDYRERACRHLSQLSDCTSRQSLIDLADYVIERRR